MVHGLADVGVDAPLDFDGHLRHGFQQAAHLVRDHALVGGQLASVVVVPPEVPLDCLLQLEQPDHHGVLSGPPVSRHQRTRGGGLRRWVTSSLNIYKGSEWVPAFAGTHASGRAGKELELFHPTHANKNLK